VNVTHARQELVAGVFLAGMVLVQAAPAEATTTGPTVIAAHRNGAVDVPGNSVFGSVAKMSVPAGNWLITATGTLQGTDVAYGATCRLLAGNEKYEAVTSPGPTGVGSYTALELLLAHHFAKNGAVTVSCATDGSTGSVLIRDLHVTAVQVGQLTDNAGTFGSGSPRTYFSEDSNGQGFATTFNNLIQGLLLPAGTWLVQATTSGRSAYDGDRVDCSLRPASSTTAADQSAEDFEGQGVARAVGLEAVITLTSTDNVYFLCRDTDANWNILSSAISAIKVGTLNYGPFIGTSHTTGTGSPTVVGRFSDDPGGVPFGTSPQPFGQASLSAGSWFATAKLSLLAAAAVNTTCQLRLPKTRDQGRAYPDTGNHMIDWLSLSATTKLTSSNTAFVACGQNAGNNQVAYWHVRLFAIKAGTMTDTLLE